MDPIEAEVTKNGNSPQEGPKDAKLESIKYKDIGLAYEFLDHTGEKWFQQVVGEHMLGVRTKQFDRYCEEMEPKVEKRRVKTRHYSYNFIKELDIFRIAEAKGKAIRIPLKDLPTTDTNQKVFSKTDFDSMAETIIQDKAVAIFKEYNDRMRSLETTNTSLSSEVVNLAKEKTQLIEEKFNIINKKRIWKISTILCGAFLVIGGGVAAVVILNLNKDNDQLFNESLNKSKIINTKVAELNSLNDKIKNQEIEYLKSRIPGSPNQVTVNATKKD